VLSVGVLFQLLDCDVLYDELHYAVCRLLLRLWLGVVQEVTVDLRELGRLEQDLLCY